MACQERSQAEDITQEEAFQAKCLALEQEQEQALWEQNSILGWSVQVIDDNFGVLDIAMVLAVSYRPAATQLPFPVPQVP